MCGSPWQGHFGGEGGHEACDLVGEAVGTCSQGQVACLFWVAARTAEHLFGMSALHYLCEVALLLTVHLLLKLGNAVLHIEIAAFRPP
jgi:hypothetical protein